MLAHVNQRLSEQTEVLDRSAPFFSGGETRKPRQEMICVYGCRYLVCGDIWSTGNSFTACWVLFVVSTVILSMRAALARWRRAIKPYSASLCYIVRSCLELGRLGWILNFIRNEEHLLVRKRHVVQGTLQSGAGGEYKQVNFVWLPAGPSSWNALRTAACRCA